MKKRYFYILLCVISLCIGGGLYIIFRPNTYVAEFARGLFPSASTIFSSLEEINCDFIKYYFPDLIWAFSLNCGLNAIFNSKKSIFVNSNKRLINEKKQINVILLNVICFPPFR